MEVLNSTKRNHKNNRRVLSGSSQPVTLGDYNSRNDYEKKFVNISKNWIILSLNNLALYGCE